MSRKLNLHEESSAAHNAGHGSNCGAAAGVKVIRGGGRVCFRAAAHRLHAVWPVNFIIIAEARAPWVAVLRAAYGAEICLKVAGVAAIRSAGPFTDNYYLNKKL